MNGGGFGWDGMPKGMDLCGKDRNGLLVDVVSSGGKWYVVYDGKCVSGYYAKRSQAKTWAEETYGEITANAF